jgi:type IV secretory pathway VirJ component
MAVLPRLLVLALLLAAPLHAESLPFGRFGEIELHRPPGPPSQLVLLLASTPGTEAITKMAASLAASGALVAVVDVPRYLAAAGHNLAFCTYPSADLEGLGRFVAKKLALPNLLPPVLAGDAAGSGLAYAALAQSPPGTFSGLLTVGFCPLYSFPRPLCGGNSLRTDIDWKKNGIRLLPEAGLDDPWVALEVPEPACEAGSLPEFAASIRRASIVHPPAAMGEPAATEDARLQEGFAKLIALHQEREKERTEEARKGPLGDLPLVEVPAKGAPRGRIAVLVTGDGGYVGLDNRLGRRLSNAGMSVIALDSLRYFWRPRTPESTTADLVRILDHFLAAWRAESALLVGYSQGADVLPFVVERLPERLRAKVSAVALVGPDSGALFDYQFGNFMAGEPRAPELPVGPQIAKIKGLKTLCIYAELENDSLCRKLPRGQVTLVPMPGGHGFSLATDIMVTRLLAEAGLPARISGERRESRALPGGPRPQPAPAALPGQGEAPRRDGYAGAPARVPPPGAARKPPGSPGSRLGATGAAASGGAGAPAGAPWPRRADLWAPGRWPG